MNYCTKGRVRGDTPANCSYEDISGSWTFYESERSGTKDIDCSSRCNNDNNNNKNNNNTQMIMLELIMMMMIIKLTIITIVIKMIMIIITIIILFIMIIILIQRNWVFATNSNFLILLSLQPLIFQTYVISWNRIYSLKYLRYTTLGSEDIGISKSEFVAKTQFLSWF